MKVLVVNGPNLNLLGEREPEIYGETTLAEIGASLKKTASKSRAKLRFFQSNHEGDLIDCLHRNRKWADGVLINPGAYTHTSIAIRDAITAIGIPTIEVHLSDLNTREEFRKKSYLSDVCMDTIMGMGAQSYTEALKKLLIHLGSVKGLR